MISPLLRGVTNEAPADFFESPPAPSLTQGVQSTPLAGH
jgi:hypothetical protein